MDKVVLDGIEYVKAAAVAKQFQYTSDYIGQLCRAKKVDARLVGRTWFVNPESLKEHKKVTHHKSPETATNELQDDDLASNVKINRIDVNAPLKNKTAKSIAFHSSDRTTSLRIDVNPELGISYYKDAETLLPSLSVKTQPVQSVKEDTHVQPKEKRFIHIEPATAKNLKITSNRKKHASFSPTELPDVALSGKLSISTYNESVSEPFTKPVHDEVVAAVAQHSKAVQDIKAPFKTEEDTSEQAEVTETNYLKNTSPALWIRIMPLVVTLIAAGVSILVVSLVAEVTVTGVTSTSNLTWYFENFWQLFDQ